jgi:hypothetical protein
MDFTSRPVLAGVGGLIIGALIGMAIGSSGQSGLEAELAAQREAAADLDELSTTVEGVGARLSALEGRLGAIEGSVSSLAESQRGRIDALAQRLEGVGTELGGAVSGLGTSVADTLSGRFESLRSELAAFGDRLVATAPGDEEEDEPAAETAGGGEPPAGEPLRIGATTMLGEGLRIFLSSVDEENGTARVAINGPTTTTLELGEPVESDGCTVTLNGFSEGTAVVEGSCGGEGGGAAPSGESGGAARSGESGQAAPGAGEAIAIGATKSFADGKVRLFLSGVDHEAKAARLALNGVTMTRLRLSEATEAAGCTVTLTGIDASGATFDVAC